MLAATARLFWRLLAILGLLLAFVGLMLPVMPTVPFLLVTLFAASRGWPSLERWLIEHPAFGEHLRDWRARGAVSRKAKWFATAGCAGSSLSMLFFLGPEWFVGVAIAVMAVVIAWLWRRPEP